MKHHWYIIALLIVSLSTSCGTSKVVDPMMHEGRQVTLSHGGGFAGTYTTYTLLDNGQLFKVTADAHEEQAPLSKDVTDQIFSNYEVLGLGEDKVESYGNLNYSITMKSGKGEHKLIWEKGQADSDKLQLFYRNVMNNIKMSRDGVKPSKSEIKADVF